MSVGFLLASRASLMDRLSFLNSLIASERRSTRAWRSSTAFVTPPLGRSLVGVGVIDNERRVGCVGLNSD